VYGFLVPLFIFNSVYAQDSSVGENILKGLTGADEFFLYLYYVVGIGLVFSGINRLKKLGHRTAFMNVDSGVTGPLMLIVLGVALAAFPSFLSVLNQSVWNDTAIKDVSVLALDQKDSSLEEQLKPLIFMIQLIGMVALLRGVLILSKSTGQGAQPGTISKGFVHIFGGFLAINILQTFSIVSKTFGVG